MRYLMGRIATLLISTVFLFGPLTALAACTASGATIVYVNGIFGDLREAREDLRKLELTYQEKTGDFETKFVNGYNPSHLGGAGDLIKSIMQAYVGERPFIEDTDLKTILLQIHPQVTTQKILLVGHSQGTYYTNAMYDYLTNNGISENSIAVYNVATPAGFVAGNGQYLTSATDKVVNKVRVAIKSAPSVESFGAGAALVTLKQTQPKDPLPPTTSFVLSAEEKAKENGGHSFSKVYLENAPNTIVSAVKNSLSGLSASKDVERDCFASPSEDVTYKVGKANLAALDFVVAKAVPAIAFVKDFALDVADKVPTNLASAVSSFAQAVIPKPRTTNLPGSHSVVDALYGSSVKEDELKDLLGGSQGGAVVLAFNQSEQKSEQGEVKGVETQKVEEEVVVDDAPLIPLPPAIGGGGISPGFGGGAPSGTQESAAEPPVVPDSTPPAPAPEPLVLASMSANGVALVPYPLDGQLDTAATNTPWSVVAAFNNDLATLPRVRDGLPFNDIWYDEHVVNDCSDGNAKTVCFVFQAPPDVTLYWAFRFTDAVDTNGGSLATSTWIFTSDTLGPAVSIITELLYFKTPLPTIRGYVRDLATPGHIFIDDVEYGTFLNTSPPEWEFTLSAGQELSEGMHTISIPPIFDIYGNLGTSTVYASMLVDLTAPVVSITSGPLVEGAELAVAEGAPVVVDFSIADTNPGDTSCRFDDQTFTVCTTTNTGTLSAVLAPGSHSVSIFANDLSLNVHELVRNFTVITAPAP